MLVTKVVKVAQHGGVEFPLRFRHGRLVMVASGHLALIRWASEGGTNAQLDKGYWTGEERWNQHRRTGKESWRWRAAKKKKRKLLS